MARKRVLDPYTSVYIDRHGKERCRFRRNGFDCALPHPSAKGYRNAYGEAKAKASGLIPLESRAVPQSIGDLIPRFYESIKFKRGGDGWQKTRRQVLEAFREEFAGDRVANFRPRHIDAILGRKMEKAGGKGGTHAAKRLREQLEALFAFAVKLEWIRSNPVEQAEEVEHRVTGFYAWTESDIAQYRGRWPLGTKQRLALELLLWTGARRSDARLMSPPKDGRIKGRAGKTGKQFDLPVAPPLAAAIEAVPTVGMTTLLVTEYGKPFTAAGFGNWFRDQCRKAGLENCTAHGLRKALARRAADQGVQQQGLKALGQWSGDREVAVYVAGANQRRLAENAIEAVHAWEQGGNIVEP
jgi:integrase